MTRPTWREVWDKHARLLWALHSAWALISGVAVLILAHNRHGFARWVVLFLALTWGSTLFVSRVAGTSSLLRFAHGLVSYLTRVMYQETLFFLIPFYFYSATVRSWNFFFVVLLAALAVLSCFDMLFDRLLREHRWFAIGFFAFVSFSALQLFLPLLLRTRIENSEVLAAAIAYLAAFALARRWRDLADGRRLAAAAVVFALVLAGVYIVRPLLPPVPLRMTALRFSGELDHRTLSAPATFASDVPRSALPRGRVYAVATVFSPERIPARVQMRFIQSGNVLRVSRTLDLTFRPEGFRIWDSVRVPATPSPAPIRVELWTAGQLLGKRTIRVVP